MVKIKITDIKLFHLSVPLKKPFKTSLRTVNSVEETIIKIETNGKLYSLGEAPPTSVITGDTNQSIRGVINNEIKPILIGQTAENIEKNIHLINNSVINNTSAKAALDMACYDLFCKIYEIPLYKFLGGYQNKIVTDLTISINSPKEMSNDAIDAVKRGYKILKLKVGEEINIDLRRIRKIRKVIGPEVKLRLDANQGWNPKKAVRLIKKLEEENLNIELIEQPVKATDLEGLKYVTDKTLIPIMADESLFSPADCLRLIKTKACDLVNIKLMKSGGIYEALKINSIAEASGIEVMIGSMLEAKISVTAAAHLAAAKKNITRLDLDAPSLLAEDPVEGGVEIDGPIITIPNKIGLGISKVNNLKQLN